jgi:septal ring factor EnvC (AmiA/AmiB activator)
MLAMTDLTPAALEALLANWDKYHVGSEQCYRPRDCFECEIVTQLAAAIRGLIAQRDGVERELDEKLEDWTLAMKLGYEQRVQLAAQVAEARAECEHAHKVRVQMSDELTEARATIARLQEAIEDALNARPNQKVLEDALVATAPQEPG